MVVTSFLLLILTVNLTCQMTVFCPKIYIAEILLEVEVNGQIFSHGGRFAP